MATVDKEEILLSLLRAQNYKDPVDKKHLPREEASRHHMLHDTKGNRKRYPLFIDSRCNGLAVRLSNILKDNQFTITDITASKYENFFKQFLLLITEETPDPRLLFADLHDIWEKALRGGFNES